MRGTIYVYSENREKLLQKFKNVILTQGISQILKVATQMPVSLSNLSKNAYESITKLKINAMAFGTGTSIHSKASTSLSTEKYRASIDSFSPSGNDINGGEVTFSIGLPTDVLSSTTIKEIALVFNSTGETNPLNSTDGKLFSAANVNFVKGANENLIIDYKIED